MVLVIRWLQETYTDARHENKGCTVQQMIHGECKRRTSEVQPLAQGTMRCFAAQTKVRKDVAASDLGNSFEDGYHVPRSATAVHGKPATVVSFKGTQAAEVADAVH